MKRYSRPLGTLLVLAGLATLAWAFAVWAWQDPFTNIYTRYEQRQLAQKYERYTNAYKPLVASGASPAATRRELRAEARRYRKSVHEGDAIGRISVPRMGLDMVLVNGTSHDTPRPAPAATRAASCRGKASSSTSPGIARPTSHPSRTSTRCAPATRSP